MYLGQRMLYEKQTLTLEDLDPVSNPSYRRAVLGHGLVVFLVWVLGQIVIVIVSAILSVLNGRFGTVTGALLAVGWWVVMGCVFWLSKVPAKLSEWKFLVDDKAAAAAVTFDHIAWAFSRRDTPVDHCRVRRFKVMGQGSRDVLEVRQGVFCGLVSCFASGNDLYIGWSFWLSLSPARWLLILLRRLFWECASRGAVYVSLQFDRARALREALHSAVREGVDVAAGQILAQGQGDDRFAGAGRGRRQCQRSVLAVASVNQLIRHADGCRRHRGGAGTPDLLGGPPGWDPDRVCGPSDHCRGQPS